MFKLASVGRLIIIAFFLSLLLPTTTTLYAQEKNTIDLSGTWKFLADRGHKRGDKGDTSKGFHESQFNDSKWRDLQIGSPWESQGIGYDGVAWYRKQFDMPAPWNGCQLILQLGSPDDGAEVYLNGKSLGTWKFNENIFCIIPHEAIQWGKTNTLAIRVWDWYKSGGVNGTNFSIQTIAPLTYAQPTGPDTLDLSITQNLPDDVLASRRWEAGWRDGGTSDTRPKLRSLKNAFRGQDAIEFDVWYPNSAEFMDALLNANERGNTWQGHGYTYLSFWYRTDSLNGHMTIQLNTGKHAWGKRGATVWQADFAVSPTSTSKDGWQRVLIPFAYFTRPKRQSTWDDVLRLDSVTDIQRLVVGYENHILQSPGKIAFAGFQVGRAIADTPFLEPISLRGLWRYKLDDQRPDGNKSDLNTKEARKNPDKLTADQLGYGEQLGYHKLDLDDNDWEPYVVSDKWMQKGGGKLGPSWYRQQVLVPQAWQGNSIYLSLGNPRETAKLFWNGKLIAQTTENNDLLAVTIPPDQVQFGKDNHLAVKVTTWRGRGGLYNGDLKIAVKNAANLQLSHTGKPQTIALPENFEMGTQPAKNLDINLQWIGKSNPSSKLTVHYELEDCFHRILTRGHAALVPTSKNKWQALATLNQSQTNQLFYGEWLRGHCYVTDDKDNIISVQTYPNDDQKHLKLKYEKRDHATLPPLAPTVEDTPYGKLKLIDVIDCAADPGIDEHPYKEGGIRNAWVKQRAYGAWKNGVSIETFKDRQYRQVNNNQFFAYRVGRGKLKAHKAYILRILVPDNTVRYQVMEIKTGRNYQGTGFRSGIALDNATDPFPLTQQYQWYDHIVINDDKTYGYQGEHTTGSENGFWVAFHDNGRSYTGQYKAGPAAAEIRLYEVPDDGSALPQITQPKNLSQRTLMMDWERQPEAPPADAVAYAKLMGMNAIAPVFQKWASHAFWESKTGFAPPGWYKAAPEGQRDEAIYGHWLNATRKAKFNFIPRIEYGGGPNLPKEAWVIGANGKIDPCGRYCRWGANILHEATWNELKAVVDELIGQHIKDNPQLAGLLWRQRQDRIKISYGPDDIFKFCNETDRPMPSGNNKQLAQWAAVTMKAQYDAWWQEKRADFLRKLRDLLKSYRSDLVLYYYNWDADGWRPGLSKNSSNTAQDWSNLYNVDRAHLYWEAYENKRKSLTDDFYVNFISQSKQPHFNIFPNLLSKDKDIVIFAAVHWQYLANNAPYINYFQTGDGIGICNMFSYEEKGRWNLQNDRYESSEMTPGGKDFGMAYMVEAFFHGDPNVITTTTYTYGQGWSDVHRRFAQAFLALPDQRGQIVTNAVSKELTDHLRARTYETKNGVYLSVVSTAFTPVKTTINIPVNKAMTVTDLVTGKQVQANMQNGKLVFEVDMTAMTLNSYLLQ